jgi:ATP-binding cassette, subfamily A (ABC1), member 3
VVKAQKLMSLIPAARKADDVATRFEVPLEKDGGPSLLELFQILSQKREGEEEDGVLSEFTVEKATLERVYLNVIRENQVVEEDV